MRQQRWWGVVAALLLIVIAYADRVNISVMLVNPEFLHHFGLADSRAYQGTLYDRLSARLWPFSHVVGPRFWKRYSVIVKV
ncbi:Uncharacterised protein [Serratia fonticola]|uniref:D-galactonate transporter n=1 Tax=Serratia fonticola TaxID=47917 RepID=A0A4U9U4U6_SERFO|nr:Uncharacterised protein [Serratia fonticola]